MGRGKDENDYERDREMAVLRMRMPTPAIATASRPAKSVLQYGEILYENECLQSPNMLYSMCLDSDGQLVLKEINGHMMWKSEMEISTEGPYQLQSQFDNNFCVSDKGGIIRVWCSNTNGYGSGKARAELRDDANLVIMGIMPLWSAKTGLITLPGDGQMKSPRCLSSLNGLYKACMRTDGNFVVSLSPPEPETVLWDTKTSEEHDIPYVLVMQYDNNVCLYRNKFDPGHAFWCTVSHERGTGRAALTLQDDGDLVAYAGKPIWSWKNGVL